MPNNTNILMIRHAEKPESGPGLAIAGPARAQAYAIYFQNYVINSAPIKLNHLFATADSEESLRPKLTIEPLANALGLKINDKHKHKHKDYAKVAAEILQNSKYNDSNILICWHHGDLLQMAAALGADSSKLPPASKWPAPPWPDQVFGWLLQLGYDSHGNLIPSQTMCINEKLMYDDYVKDPPAIG